MTARIALGAALMLAACGTPKHTDRACDSPPRLVEDGGRWYITGLDPIAAQLADRGTLFVATQPLPGTGDRQGVAVLKSLGPSPAGGGAVGVAAICEVRGRQRAAGQEVAPLSATGTKTVGQCLAQVVDENDPSNPARWVTLDVGRGDGVEPGDKYLLLGTPVTVAGHVPTGIDTKRDGRCQIPVDAGAINAVTARCDITQLPPDRPRLQGVYVVHEQREE